MARRFVFKLETVRRVRQLAEDAQKRVVAEKIGRIVHLREEVAALHRALEVERDRKRIGQQPGRLDMRTLRSRQVYVGALSSAIVQDEKRIEAMEAELVKERAKLADLSTQRKALDKLRERHLRRYEVAVRREEQAVSDEAALTGFIRSGGVT